MPKGPYADTRRNWRDSQADIARLFSKYGIGDVQWSLSDSQNKMALSFVKNYPAKMGWTNGTRCEIKPAKRIVVRLTLPLKLEGQERNVSFRVLYWYLKSKMEAIEFSFTDGTELFNFEREFFGNVMIEDVHGNPAEAFDAYKRGDVELAPPNRVIALPA